MLWVSRKITKIRDTLHDGVDDRRIFWNTNISILTSSLLPIYRGHPIPIKSRNTPIGRSFWRDFCAFRDFKFWPKVYLWHARAVCNTVLYFTAIYGESKVIEIYRTHHGLETPYGGHHWFGYWLVASSTPNNYLKQYWFIANVTLGNKSQCNFHLIAHTQSKRQFRNDIFRKKKHI